MELGTIVSSALMAGIGAVGSGLLSSVSDITKKAVTENFSQLKNRILSKYGSNEQVSEAFTLIKLDPESKKLPELVQKCAVELKFDDDPELYPFAKQLLDALEKDTEGKRYFKGIMGNNNIYVEANNGKVSINK